jgi:hypothetical protein
MAHLPASPHPLSFFLTFSPCIKPMEVCQVDMRYSYLCKYIPCTLQIRRVDVAFSIYSSAGILEQSTGLGTE